METEEVIITADFRPIRAYPRYGGLMQTYPLTPDQEEYDNVCRAIDYAEKEISSKSMSLFTAGEFMWFSWFVNKTWMFPKQDQLDRQLVALGKLLQDLNDREAGKNPLQILEK